MDARELLGLRIKKIRCELGLSQEELAYRCGMHASHIGFLERGHRNPTLDTLERISLGLDISLSELFDYSQEPEAKVYDETTNKLISYIIVLPPENRKQVLAIVKTFVNMHDTSINAD